MSSKIKNMSLENKNKMSNLYMDYNISNFIKQIKTPFVAIQTTRQNSKTGKIKKKY